MEKPLQKLPVGDNCCRSMIEDIVVEWPFGMCTCPFQHGIADIIMHNGVEFSVKCQNTGAALKQGGQ